MTVTEKKRSDDLAQEAQALGIDVAEVTNAALRNAIDRARQESWREEHAAALSAQDDWIDRNGHPFAEIAAGTLADAIKRR